MDNNWTIFSFSSQIVLTSTSFGIPCETIWLKEIVHSIWTPYVFSVIWDDILNYFRTRVTVCAACVSCSTTISIKLLWPLWLFRVSVLMASTFYSFIQLYFSSSGLFSAFNCSFSASRLYVFTSLYFMIFESVVNRQAIFTSFILEWLRLDEASESERFNFLKRNHKAFNHIFEDDDNFISPHSRTSTKMSFHALEWGCLILCVRSCVGAQNGYMGRRNLMEKVSIDDLEEGVLWFVCGAGWECKTFVWSVGIW